METLIAKKSSEALVTGYERAKVVAASSGLRLAQTGAAWLDVQHANDLRQVAMYEAEIASRIAARIEANRAADMDVAKLEAAYWLEMARIEEIEAAKVEAIEMRWAEMVASGEAEQYED